MLIGLDFESDAIENRPKFPPKPVGYALLPEDVPGFYYAWGHPTENNVDYERARMELAEYLEDDRNEFIFHNAPFDCSIIEERLELKVPWERVHDTMVLAFLTDPFGELSLKPLAEKIFGEPPTEQEAVRDWLVRHGICRANDKSWGAYISRAPGKLVGTYAIGDVQRTVKLFKHYMAQMNLPPTTRPVAPNGEAWMKSTSKETYWATGSVPREAYGPDWS